MKITIDLEAGPAKRALAQLQRRAENLAPAFRGIGSDVVADASLRFKSGTDPYGSRWQALAAATIRQRRGSGAQPLLDTGRLRNSVTFQASADGVDIGSRVAYAAIHQFGGTISYAARSLRVRLRTDARGNLLRGESGGAIFAKDRQKRAVTKWGEAKAWTVKIPARPYLAVQSRGLPREYAEIIQDQLRRHLLGDEVRP